MTPSIPLTVPEEAECAFDELFHSYYGRLAKLLYRVTGDIGRAEEMAVRALLAGCITGRLPPAKMWRVGSIALGLAIWLSIK